MKLRMSRTGYNPPVAFVRSQMGKNGQMGGVFSLKNGVFDADEIMNNAN